MKPYGQQWLIPAIMPRVAVQAMFGISFEVSNTGITADNISALINRAEEQQNRFSFGMFVGDQSFQVAKAMGLGFEDHEVKENEQYLYRVYPAANNFASCRYGLFFDQYGRRLFTAQGHGTKRGV